MPLYCYYCAGCRNETEVIQYSLTEVITCVKCGETMERRFPSNIMVKMKGEGGLPSRRKQIFNTTYRKHPKLD